MEHVENLQQQVQSRVAAITAFAAMLEDSGGKPGEPKTARAAKLKGMEIVIDADGNCRCKSLDTGETFSC